MTPQTLQTIAGWCGAEIVQGDPQVVVSEVSTDTRTIARGSVFVAIIGEFFDAHDFAGKAAEAGAAAVLVSKPVDVPGSTAVLMADDSQRAFHRWAAAWRRQWGGTVIGITGSNGKTSTKDLVNAVLSQNAAVNATRGNLNNHVGLPLTVLATNPDDQYGVWELGMNHFGEIAPLAEIAAPDLGIITNVGTAHIEFLGSREGIAQEKGVLAEAVHPDGCVVLNANDDFTPSIASRCRAPVLTAGIDAGDVRVTNLSAGADGCRFTLELPDKSSAPVLLPAPGLHMAANAALAAAACFHLGLRIEEIVGGLEKAKLNKGRLQFLKAGGLNFLDDSYNANPESMRAGLEALLTIPVRGRRIAVLGRMAEIGPDGPAEHLALGRLVHDRGIDLLCTVGSPDARGIADGFLAAGGSPARVISFDDQASCAQHLRAAATPDDLILIKGSRSAAMERVIELLPA